MGDCECREAFSQSFISSLKFAKNVYLLIISQHDENVTQGRGKCLFVCLFVCLF